MADLDTLHFTFVLHRISVRLILSIDKLLSYEIICLSLFIEKVHMLICLATLIWWLSVRRVIFLKDFNLSIISFSAICDT